MTGRVTGRHCDPQHKIWHATMIKPNCPVCEISTRPCCRRIITYHAEGESISLRQGCWVTHRVIKHFKTSRVYYWWNVLKNMKWQLTYHSLQRQTHTDTVPGWFLPIGLWRSGIARENSHGSCPPPAPDSDKRIWIFFLQEEFCGLEYAEYASTRTQLGSSRCSLNPPSWLGRGHPSPAPRPLCHRVCPYT